MERNVSKKKIKKVKSLTIIEEPKQFQKYKYYANKTVIIDEKQTLPRSSFKK